MFFAADGIASCALSYEGKPILLPSPLNLRTWTANAASQGYRLVSTRAAREAKDSWTPVAGRPDQTHKAIAYFRNCKDVVTMPPSLPHR